MLPSTKTKVAKATMNAIKTMHECHAFCLAFDLDSK